jgi:hypothetical protein
MLPRLLPPSVSEELFMTKKQLQEKLGFAEKKQKKTGMKRARGQ